MPAKTGFMHKWVAVRSKNKADALRLQELRALAKLLGEPEPEPVFRICISCQKERIDWEQMPRLCGGCL